MKKNTANEPEVMSFEQTLGKSFWRWFSFSVLALAIAAALPARSADVFIDEGDGDFASTPVSTTASSDTPVGSDTVAPIETQVDAQMDAQMGESIDPMAASPAMESAAAAPVKAKKKEKKAAAKKSSKKKTVVKTKAIKKKDKKMAGRKSKKNTVSTTSKSTKRKVASIEKFAGGQYATTSKECALESAPGAGDTVGTSKASRKLWVEESGNTSYWKVYGKAGSAAYLPRDCF